ncbi:MULTISPECIES: hypothetical protein [Bacillus]|uniref:hypothetical protein n=1 Tax=Bacillus TaxID=1386 RepID=UPI00080E8E6C|nr:MULTISPECIES: hypothetical protein [Bacillus]MBX9436278.1 hypothetical protein [Bacillus paralicheniformis]MCY1631338.1 hypothetical protein [Bacillus paralicheniformis]MDE1384593.1 hypothetical protein [Bacillus paralicheniformis]TAI50161.1 hypothetical protein CXP52_21470 [Bacillus paralicheniformis]GIN78695.1 hypothetical protein J41TS8_37360 [Bacillus sp. J41TS8]
MKKILTFVLVTFLSLSFANSIYADEIDDLDLDLSKAEITYQDDEITVGYWGNDPEIAKKIEKSPTSVSSTEVPHLITPAKTVTGPGGKVTIDAGNSGQIIYWTVKPNTAWPWVFGGRIELRYYSGFKRNAFIKGSGGLGFSASGYVTMNKNNGGIATLKGTAAALNNSKFTVLPGASIPFKKR